MNTNTDVNTKNKNKIFLRFFSVLVFVFIFFFLPRISSADVLLPGNINTCGELAVPGTYTLTSNMSNGTSTCFTVSSDNITIEGGGYTISGTGSTAIDGRAYTSNILTEGANGYTNLIINDLNITGYTTGINISGNSDLTGNGVNNGYAGDGGDSSIYYSVVGSIISNGGISSSQNFGGLGGNIAFTDTNLNISNSTISLLGGTGTVGRNTDGGLDLSYSGTLNKTNSTLSSLSFLNDNASIYTNYAGGGWPILPGNISTCGTLYATTSATFTLTQNISGITGTCFTIFGNDITIDGAGYSIISATSTNTSFAISAGSYSNFTLASTTVTDFPNLVTSSSSVTISGHNLNLSNQYIAAQSLTLNYTGSLTKIGATISSLTSLIVNGTSYGSQNAGILLDWVLQNSGSRYWRSITSSADGTKLAAVENGGRIYTSTDSGVTWTARDSSRGWYSITSSADGTKLAATVYDGQIYTSVDSGITWTAQSSGSKVWYSITSSADGTKLAAVVQNDQIYTSTDSGVTWTARDSSRSWLSITTSADGTKLAAVVNGGQIYTSTNSGVTWTAQASGSRNWQSITSSADGTKLAATVYDGQIYTSVDSGITWTARDSSRGWYSITSSADGTKLAATVYDGQIYTSVDSGITWTAQSSGSKVWYSITSSSDGTKLAAVVSGGQVYTHEDDIKTLSVDILTPQASTYTSWSPTISWGTATSCYYSYDNFVSTSTANCGLGGSDISNPGLESHTLYIKGIDTNGVIVEKNVSFTFSLGVTISVPTSGQTVTSWSPIINWDPSSYGNISNCYYSYDNFVSTSTVSCIGTGLDILPPTSGTSTLYLKVVDSNGNVGSPNVTFGYNPLVAWTARDSSRSWYSITSSTDGTKLAAVVQNGQIYTSTDSGVTWIARASGSRNWYNITSSSDGTKLAAVVYGGQIYTSTDSGVTWTARESSRQWYSITSSSDGTKLAAVVRYGQIYTSTDSGVNWTARDSSRNWFSITSSSDGTKLAAVVSSGQIYIYDTDSLIRIILPTTSSSFFARSWSALVNWGSSVSCYYSYDNWISTSTVNCANNGNDIAYPLVSGTQTLYIKGVDALNNITNQLVSFDFEPWTARESSRTWYSITSSSDGTKLAAVVNGGQIYTSTDSGITWTARESARQWVSITSSADGTKLAAVSSNGDQIYTSNDSGVSWTARDFSRQWFSITSSSDGTKLAAVVLGGQIYTSTNSGITWTARDSSRNWRSITSSSDGTKLAAVVYSGQVYTSVSTPSIITPTASSTVTSWSPSVSWDRSLACEYSYDNSTWSNASCNGTGSDIDAPVTIGSKTLYIKGTDFQNTVSTSSVSFNYLLTLSGNSVSSCGSISTSGTYTLTQNITDVSGTCFAVNANNVTINGGGFSVTAQGGNTSYAVTSGSYTGLILQNISFSGFGQGDISSTATVTYSGTDLDLSNSTSTASALVISYTNSLTILNTYFSNLSSLIINNIDLGSFVAGLFTWSEQDISTCQTISSPGTYKLTADISNISGSCFNIQSDKVIIDGDGHTISSTNGNTDYAFVATNTNGNAYTGIAVKNLTLTGFGGGVDTRGIDGVTGDVVGTNGGIVTLHTVNFPTNTISVNTSGGDGFYENNTTAQGGNAGNVRLVNSTVGGIISSGGDTIGDLLIGYDNGIVYGGSAGVITNINSTVTTTTVVAGIGYIPGCMISGYSNYDINATYEIGGCGNDISGIGIARDNLLGNTVTSQNYIQFFGYSNYGIVDGYSEYYSYTYDDNNIYRENKGNYGTTTGGAYFEDYGHGGGNFGYVGDNQNQGAYFYESTNYGVVEAETWFEYSNNATSGIVTGLTIFYGDSYSNFGIINGEVIFSGDSGNDRNYNEGTVNGDATFKYYGDNHGTVTGTISYTHGCSSDPLAFNYTPSGNIINDYCEYYGVDIDLPQGVTYTGDLSFSSGYSNYGTVNGNAGYNTSGGSTNYGTTTGNATFYDYYTGLSHDSGDNTLYIDGSFSYLGTGVVGGLIKDETSTLITNFEFSNGQSNDYTTQGNVIFNDTTFNNDSVIGTTTFNTTYYASTTPTGGVISFETADWTGGVNGQVLGSDSSPITTYVFHGNTKNTGNIVGNAIFYDDSYNAGNITGNVVYMNASNGTYTLTGSQQWAGTISGTIKGNDGIDITNLVFNNSSTNETTVGSGISSVFNNSASNNGTINGNALFNGTTFRIGTVNGTATLSGLAHTIQGVSNVINFVKQLLTPDRDTLYLTQGSTLNISGLATILGFDADTLLTIRSTSATTNANLNINGTLNADFLRLKNISNSGLSQDVSTKTIFDDGSNSGFTFRTNSTPSSRGGVTSSYTPPALPVSRGGGAPTSPSQPTVINNGSIPVSGTLDKFFVKNIAPLLFKETPKFNIFNNSKILKTANIGATVIPEIFKNLMILNSFKLAKIPTNFLNSVSKFVLNKDTKLDLFTVKSNGKSITTNVKYDKVLSAVTQTVKTQTNQKLDISLNTEENSLSGVFNGQTINFIKGSVSITTPSISGIYSLKADKSNVTLSIQVTEPVKVESVKKFSVWKWIKSWSR